MAVSALPLPPPYMGENNRIPAAALEFPYCERCDNYNLDDGIPRLRKGDLLFSNTLTLTDTSLNLSTYGQGNSQKLFQVLWTGTHLKWYDISSTSYGAAALTIACTNPDEIQTLYFNKYLFYFSDDQLTPAKSGVQQYTGSAWGAAGYTFPAGFKPFGGNVHNHRAYIIERDSARFVYSGVDSIAGDLTASLRDYSGIVSQKSNLYGIRSVSLSEGDEQGAIQCFVFDSGEVLAFSGAWPDSPDWRLKSRFIIPRPLYYNCFVDCEGDSWIITECGLISIRDLFTKGVKRAREEGPSAAITNRWDQIMTHLQFTYGGSALRLYTKGVYDSANDRIYIQFPVYFDRNGDDQGTFFRLVYSLKNGAWFEHYGDYSQPNLPVSTGGAVFFRGYLHYAVDQYAAVYAAETSTYNYDNIRGIPFNLRTARLPVEKFGVNKIHGIELIMQSDCYNETNFSFIGDFGVVQTAAQTVNGNATNMSKVFVNMGIEAGYVQLDISGTTVAGKTVGQNIYGMNLVSTRGGLR